MQGGRRITGTSLSWATTCGLWPLCRSLTCAGRLSNHSQPAMPAFVWLRVLQLLAVVVISASHAHEQEALLDTKGSVRVLGGGGGGKTRVIANLRPFLGREGFCEPNRLVAVSFTNKGAEEKRTRVETLLGVECRRMW